MAKGHISTMVLGMSIPVSKLVIRIQLQARVTGRDGRARRLARREMNSEPSLTGGSPWYAHQR